MKTEERHVCPNCGHEFSGEVEFCPNCMLRGALEERSFSEEAETTFGGEGGQFEHFEVFKGEDGKPVELGRGAMGITYKAFDVNLRCPVTLKVISERYLGDESARLRFLREARAAASLRHSNVASVLHLGRTGTSYFYAMEFVAGETLKRWAEIDILHVPYKGPAQAINDVLGGRVSMVFTDLVTGLPHAKAGNLRALAVSRRSGSIRAARASARQVSGE